jgi:hypothetical protein
MRNTLFALVSATVVLGCGVGSVGCGQAEPEPELAPDFPENTGQPAQNAKPYPAGPYGIGKGSIINNYKFVGYVNSVANSGTLAEIQMAEFYNPNGDGLHEEGSVFPVGAPKPKALLIVVASVWCGPCNTEADTVLPAHYAEYKPQGGEFLAQLADGPTPGKAATQKSLYNWATKYDVDYPLTIDPTYKLSALFDQDAFPANMIIDPRTMRIVEVVAGVPDAAFWAKYEQVLAGQI